MKTLEVIGVKDHKVSIGNKIYVTGAKVELSDSEASLLLSHYPFNFKLVEGGASKDSSQESEIGKIAKNRSMAGKSNKAKKA